MSFADEQTAHAGVPNIPVLSPSTTSASILSASGSNTNHNSPIPNEISFQLSAADLNNMDNIRSRLLELGIPNDFLVRMEDRDRSSEQANHVSDDSSSSDEEERSYDDESEKSSVTSRSDTTTTSTQDITMLKRFLDNLKSIQASMSNSKNAPRAYFVEVYDSGAVSHDTSELAPIRTIQLKKKSSDDSFTFGISFVLHLSLSSISWTNNVS